MGWEGDGFTVHVTLDAHAGDREREDAALWRELRGRLVAVCREDRYAPIVWNPPEEPPECGAPPVGGSPDGAPGRRGA